MGKADGGAAGRSPLTIDTGDDVFRLIAGAEFIDAWQDLYERCPWATPFQSPGFVTTWYRAYRSRFDPVIVAKYRADGALCGLLTLAVQVDAKHARKALVASGDYQAEYQVWMCEAQDTSFAHDALCAVAIAFPRRDIAFTYLPPGVPVADLLNALAFRGRCRLQSVKRPVVTIERQRVVELLATKSNRTRISRLAKDGDFNFERVRDNATLSRLLDDAIPQYDFRHGALNDAMPFGDDPLRRAFHLALMQEAPAINHVTALRVGRRVAACNVGLVDRGTVYLCVFAHSPFFARHSPGKLFLLLLQRHLADTGATLLDLTPGGDPWKDPVATSQHDAGHLVVYGSAIRCLQATARRACVGAAKALASIAGVSPRAAKRSMKSLRTKLRAMRPWRIAGALAAALESRANAALYRHDSVTIFAGGGAGIGVDDLPALLLFTSPQWWCTRQAFLARALARLEKAEHVYTFVRDGKLRVWGWVAQDQRSAAIAGLSEQLPPGHGCMVVHGFGAEHDAPEALVEAVFRQIVADAMKQCPGRALYVFVEPRSCLTGYLLKRNGFAPVSSLRYRRFVALSRKAVQCEAA